MLGCVLHRDEQHDDDYDVLKSAWSKETGKQEAYQRYEFGMLPTLSMTKEELLEIVVNDGRRRQKKWWWNLRRTPRTASTIR